MSERSAAGSASGAVQARSAETARARQAWADYLALGPDRSLEKLLERYQTAPGSGPTRRLMTLKTWSSAFGWQARLQAIADEEAHSAAEREAAYRREILESGFAVMHERVKALNQLADVLLGDLTADDSRSRRWLRDTKGIGSGDNFREVEIERFNAAEVEQWRGLLDDIAKETGGRTRTVKVDIEATVRMVAEQMGLDADEAVQEVARVLQESRRGALS